MRCVAAALCVLIATGCRAFQPAPCFEVPAVLDVDKAVRILRTATRVEEDGVGIAGAPSCYVAAYRVILASGDASERFRDVYNSGTASGKIYALAGLYRADRKTFERLNRSAFARSAKTVPFLMGCVLHERPIAEVVKAIPTGCLFVPCAT